MEMDSSGVQRSAESFEESFALLVMRPKKQSLPVLGRSSLDDYGRSWTRMTRMRNERWRDIIYWVVATYEVANGRDPRLSPAKGFTMTKMKCVGWMGCNECLCERN